MRLPAGCVNLQYKPFLEGDNRRTQRRSCISISKLQRILGEGQSIHANLGNATSKVARILAQAETWYKKHESLLLRCSSNSQQADGISRQQNVQIAELTEAVESAASGVSLDLDEALELKELAEKKSKRR